MEYLELVGLQGSAHSRPYELSGGMRPPSCSWTSRSPLLTLRPENRFREEAILLADRLVILSANPGKVRRILEIDLERPRDSMSRPFLEMRKEVLGLLDEV